MCRTSPPAVEGMLQLEIHAGGKDDLMGLKGEEVPFSPGRGVHLLHHSDS